MHRVFVAVLLVPTLALAACGGGGDGRSPAESPPAPEATSTTTLEGPESSPTAAEHLPPTATATTAPATPTPAVEAVTPITQQTNPTPTGGVQSPAAPTPTPPPTAGNPASATVGVTGIGRFFWSPGKVAIAPGGTVTWAWSGNDFHDLAVAALGYTSGNPVKTGSYTLTFPNPGTYAVSCSIHPDTMRGTVTVE